MQLDKIFSTQFLDSTTGLPLDSLTGVTITILEINETDGTTLSTPVNAQACINGGNGFYRYYFSSMNTNSIYEYFINPNNSNTVIASGWVDKRQNYLDKPLSSIIGSFNINKSSQYDFGMQDRKNLEAIKEAINKNIDLSEVKSHIDIAKDTIITTIEGIETDIDLTTVTEGIGVLKQRFTKLSDWLKTEQKKEIESKDMENEGKLIELQSKIDEMEEAFEEMQNLSKSELDEKQKLIEDMEETAKEIMEELDKEKKDSIRNIISSLSE